MMNERKERKGFDKYKIERNFGSEKSTISNKPYEKLKFKKKKNSLNDRNLKSFKKKDRKIKRKMKKT